MAIMTVFPDTDAYMINWMGGSSGAFLSICTFNLATNKEIDIQVSKTGHAHNNQNLIFQNSKRKSTSTDEEYKTVEPVKPNEPLMFVEHVLPDFNILFTRFPKCKVIRITLSEKMIPRLLGNLFYKNTCNGLSLDAWNDLKYHVDVFKKYEKPQDASNEDVREYIMDSLQFFKIDDYYANDYVPSFHKDNFFSIDFYDIIYNTEKVMYQLAPITNGQVTPFLLDQAKRYREKQMELVKAKMPWLDDK